MEEPVFDTLRTQEQLGYAVNMVMRNTYGVLGITVTVNTQATKFTPQHVDERIEAFFKDFVKDSFTEETATKAIQSLIKLKLTADVTLEQEVNRNWSEIISKEYVFDRPELLAAVLTEISTEDMKKMLTPLLAEKKLSIQVVGYSEPSDNDKPEDDDKETVLKYHSGEGLVAVPEEWKNKLKMNPVLLITS